MIYLIGGPPRCGKSTLARQMAKKRQCSWLSVDTLESIVMTSLSASELKKQFPKRTMRRATQRSNDKMYARYPAREIVAAYKKQAKASWKALEMLIDVTLREGRDFVIEGYHVSPAFMAKMQHKYGAKQIRSVVLYRTDPEQIVTDCLKNTQEGDWFISQTQETETYEKIANMIAQYGHIFSKAAKKYQVESFDMDRQFKRQLRLANRYLMTSG